MADFDPRQLDQLEDALEGLEDIDDLESLELSPALTERLAEYQDVLALCRETFPVEEPRADLLADVLAEAHAVSRRPKLGEADGSAWRRFWTRWRGSLIPGVALAGTAAAVLLLLEPEQKLDQSSALLTDTSQSQQDEKPEPVEDTESMPSEPTHVPQPEQPDEPEPEPIVEPEPPTSEKPGSSAGSVAVKKSKPRIGKDTAPAVEPEPTPEPLNKDETWTALDRANADRRKGDCDRARSRYEQIIAASTDTLAVSRAKAGIGLCLEQDRRTSEANQWFEQARSGNVGIDSWIEEQRNEQPLPGETKKHKSKALPANADAL